MMNCTRLWKSIAVACLLATTVHAADEPKKPDPSKNPDKAAAKSPDKNPDKAAAKSADKSVKAEARKLNPLFRVPESIALSDEQKAKIEEIRKEFEPKLAEIQAKANVLTDEQKAAQQKIGSEAKKSGKKGKELRDELEAALKLTDEQKKTMAEAKQEASALHKAVQDKISEVLTADQRKMLEESKKKPNPKKGAAA